MTKYIFYAIKSNRVVCILLYIHIENRVPYDIKYAVYTLEFRKIPEYWQICFVAKYIQHRNMIFQ